MIDYNKEDWIEKFEDGDMGIKKTMLTEVVDKIYLSKDKIDVIFKFQLAESFNDNPFDPNNGSNTNENDVCVLLGEPHGLTSQKHDYVYITISEKIA